MPRMRGRGPCGPPRGTPDADSSAEGGSHSHCAETSKRPAHCMTSSSSGRCVGRQPSTSSPPLSSPRHRPAQRRRPIGGSQSHDRHRTSARKGFAVCTANLRKANVADCIEVLAGLTRPVAQSGCSTPLEVAILQEAPSWRSGSGQFSGLAGWSISGSAVYPCASAVSDRVRALVERSGEDTRCVYVTTCDCLIVSVYAPDPSYGIEADNVAWEAVRQFRGRGRFRRKLIVVGEIKPPACPQRRGHHRAMGGWALATATIGPQPVCRFIQIRRSHSMCHRGRSDGVEHLPAPLRRRPAGGHHLAECGRQNGDPDLMGESEACRFWGVAALVGRSDPSVVWAQVHMTAAMRRPTHAREPTLKGWAPRCKDDAEAFRQRLGT